jgi:hypothetical protein
MKSQQSIHAPALLKVAPLAAAVAAFINVVLFYIGNASGLMDPTVGIPGPDGTQFITVVPVILSSVIPTLIAAGVLALLNRFTANPLRIFGILCIVLTIVSFVNPFMAIPNVPMSMGIWLDVMHVVVAAVIWYAFSKYTKK